jgi:hypothetical protein
MAILSCIIAIAVIATMLYLQLRCDTGNHKWEIVSRDYWGQGPWREYCEHVRCRRCGKTGVL